MACLITFCVKSIKHVYIAKFEIMIEYLKKWMYVNDVENENLLKIAEIIEKDKKKPEIFSSQAEILYYFWLLSNWELSVEEFLMFNDTFFSKGTYEHLVKSGFDAVYYVKNLSVDSKEGKIFIFDKLYEELIKKEKLDNSFIV